MKLLRIHILLVAQPNHQLLVFLAFSCLLNVFFEVLLAFTDSCYLPEKSRLFLPYSFAFFRVLSHLKQALHLTVCLELNVYIKDLGIGPGFEATCGINHLLYNIKTLLPYIKILSYLGQKGFLCSDFLLSAATATVQL